nr:unnamed protein product [Callosobruchus analis]
MCDDNFLAAISEIVEQKMGIKETKQKLCDLENKVADLRRANNKLESEVEMLQQHNRRKSFRIYGMEDKQGQNISEQVRTLCREKLGIHLSEDNIETCFWSGRGGNGKHAVLFTVNSYSLKLLLLKNRNKLKGTKITVAEDMAPSRFNLYKKTIQKYDKRSV